METTYSMLTPQGVVKIIDAREIPALIAKNEIMPDSTFFDNEMKSWVCFKDYKQLHAFLSTFASVKSEPDDVEDVYSPAVRSIVNLPWNQPRSEYLQECLNCHHVYSKRADKCPKCGNVVHAKCNICMRTIPKNSHNCPECGDPKPFEQANIGKIERFTHPTRISNNGSSTKFSESVGPTGVGGWLLLLIVGMMVLGPIIGAWKVYAGIALAEKFYLEVTLLEGWATYKLALWFVFLISVVLSVFGGWRLKNSDEWDAVRQAKVILWLAGPAANFVMGVLLPLIMFNSSAISNQAIGGFIGSCIGVFIWTLYLSKSVRVRNTYTLQSTRKSAETNSGEMDMAREEAKRYVPPPR
jgi:hypothetical protein